MVQGESWSAAQPGPLLLGLAAGGRLRWAAVELTAAVEEARRRHDLSPIAAVALGRALAGAALLQRLSARSCRKLVLTLVGDGPLGRVHAEADAVGNLRGLVGEPHVDSVDEAGGKLRIGRALGNGTLRVARERVDGTLWESRVALVSGEVGLDLAHFLDQSEQIRSAVLVGVLEGPDGVRAAGGMIIEALPGAPDATIDQVVSNVEAIPSVSRLLAGHTLEPLLDAVLAGFDRSTVEASSVRFCCSCRRDTLLPHLSTLDPEDRDELVDELGRIVAECAFCGARYAYSSGELEAQ